ncbi:unnamed protein product [Mytilus coruscus]|uniref:Uncharacterized protein n=1 Tax=Mytilus coruscus TaxID=42192 RepID=A0A6J8DWY5_MYTCO|nr:unnamed protein product [Mytilus coruscus]
MNNWSPSTKAIELVTALKDEAMVCVSFLTPETKRSFSALCAAMSNRSGDHGVCFKGRDVRKSFPTIDTATHSTLSVEYMLRGLLDQIIAIELLRGLPDQIIAIELLRGLMDQIIAIELLRGLLDQIIAIELLRGLLDQIIADCWTRSLLLSC